MGAAATGRKIAFVPKVRAENYSVRNYSVDSNRLPTTVTCRTNETVRRDILR